MTRLQEMSDEEFVRTVQQHTAELLPLIRAIGSYQAISAALKEEAERRSRAVQAVPGRVDAALQAIMEAAR